ncbi:TPA: hypothetical protein N0F65_010346 [Lagenidium giganteum]|uniref:Uncharacterized protein n=1 Tax=Lagenidium giganteum TaxID=4803 RepID=A0AAV2Z755_9STRA|nr:TPA: hypothetical protein N0F65_010346 [Lagenidium giganteum]
MTLAVAIEGGGVAALRQYAQQHAPKEGTKAEKEVRLSGRDGKGNARIITTSELREVAQTLRELRHNTSSSDTTPVPTLLQLLRSEGGSRATVVPVDASLAVEESKQRQKRITYMDKRRDQLLRLDEEMKYGRLVRNIHKHSAAQDMQRGMKSVKQHLSIGANMIVARITAFMVVYMVSKPLTDSETKRVIAGLGAAIGMTVIEMVLYIARAAKLESVERAQQSHPQSVFG